MTNYYWIILLGLISGTSYCQSKSTIAKPLLLFSVDRTPTYTDEFKYLYTKNHKSKPEDFTESKINEYLNLFINFKLKVKEAKALGIDD